MNKIICVVLIFRGSNEYLTQDSFVLETEFKISDLYKLAKTVTKKDLINGSKIALEQMIWNFILNLNTEECNPTYSFKIEFIDPKELVLKVEPCRCCKIVPVVKQHLCAICNYMDGFTYEEFCRDF